MTGLEFALTATKEGGGGWSNHPDDPGGATMFGVTERLARRHGYRGPMRGLSLERAHAIMAGEFWHPLGLDEIRSRYIAAEIFDTAVNMGPSAAAKISQRACILMGEDPGPVDGALGPRTRAAINRLIPRYERHLYHALNGYQFLRYVELWESDPQRRRSFIRGWMTRLGRFPEMAWAT